MDWGFVQVDTNTDASYKVACFAMMVERLIRFVKDNFLAGRVFGTITELNLEAIGWCNRQNSIYHKAVDCIPCEKHQKDCMAVASVLAKTQALA